MEGGLGLVVLQVPSLGFRGVLSPGVLMLPSLWVAPSPDCFRSGGQGHVGLGPRWPPCLVKWLRPSSSVLGFRDPVLRSRGLCVSLHSSPCPAPIDSFSSQPPPPFSSFAIFQLGDDIQDSFTSSASVSPPDTESPTPHLSRAVRNPYTYQV